MRMPFSQEELNFLKENYPTKGCLFCAEKLNRTLPSIQNKIFRMGLKLSNIKEFYINLYYKENDQFKVNADNFIKPSTPETVYVLGLLWADGHVRKHGNINSINLKSVSPDGDEFYAIMSKTGKWNYYKYPSKNRLWKDSILVTTNNKPLTEFLLNMDYNAKSEKSADKILAIIPNNLQHYWFRGLLDGDGHISKDTIHAQLSFSSSYNQDWKYLTKQLDNLEIKYSVKRIVNKKQHKSSYVRISNRKDCLKFLNFIYSGNNKLCLQRKYSRYKAFVNKQIELN